MINGVIVNLIGNVIFAMLCRGIALASLPINAHIDARAIRAIPAVVERISQKCKVHQALKATSQIPAVRSFLSQRSMLLML
jgi:hypothetical protein